jgi:hypothetical protein
VVAFRAFRSARVTAPASAEAVAEVPALAEAVAEAPARVLETTGA